MDIQTRKKEIAKLQRMKKERPAALADARKNPKPYIQVAKALDINWSQVMDIISPGKVPFINYALDELNLAMLDTPGRPSSKIEDTGDFGTVEDIAVASYLQQLYTIGSRFPRHPLVATFTLTPIAGGTVFNPYEYTDIREEEMIEPEVDYTMFLAESWSTMDDTARIPWYDDDQVDRQKRRVTELSQIELMKFRFSEDAKAIYKYGIGVQWSFETAFREIRMQLLGSWVMRQAITDRIFLLQDLIGVAIDHANAENRKYEIPEGGASGKWTWEKLENYNNRWRLPHRYDCIIAEPNGITKFKQTDWGSDNWTLGHLAMMTEMFATRYEDMRMQRKIKFIDIPDLAGEDGESNKFSDNDYLFMQKSGGVGQVYNTGMTRDSMETVEGNQSYVRRFTMGTRFYPLRAASVEHVTLS